MGSKIIKQDINFLEKPLWFQNARQEGIGFVWTDIDGYEYRSGYRAPDKIDMLFLFYLLFKSQQNGYEQIVQASRWEVLKQCGLSTKTKYYYDRLEDSLKRWGSVIIDFKGSFYDGKEYKSIGFHIIDSYRVEEKNKKIIVRFNADWLLKIKESQFFKLINFEQYKALRRPVSRRLHEILCKNFLGRETWSIGLVKLGRKLPLTGDEVRTKKGVKRVIYASHVFQKIKPAINEINKLSQDPDIIKKGGIKLGELFSISYKITGKKQDRVIIFKKIPVELEQKEETGVTSAQTQNLESLIALLKRKPSAKLKRIIAEYLQIRGADYVKWNILYTNQRAKKSYSPYLQKALAGNYAEQWKEEESRRIEAKRAREEEEGRKAEKERRRKDERKQAKKEKPLFKEKIAGIPEEIKIKLWEKADMAVPNDQLRRENIVKLNYLVALWEYLAEKRESITKGLLDDMFFAFSLKSPG